MSEGERPNPDALLARMKREEEASARGKLKIFFGMCPGVGKTYAMLQAARQKQAEGCEVLIGIVETHGRKETEAYSRECRSSRVSRSNIAAPPSRKWISTRFSPGIPDLRWLTSSRTRTRLARVIPNGTKTFSSCSMQGSTFIRRSMFNMSAVAATRFAKSQARQSVKLFPILSSIWPTKSFLLI